MLKLNFVRTVGIAAVSLTFAVAVLSAQEVLERFFERWVFLLESENRIVVGSLVLDLANASQAIEDAATSPERILLETDTDIPAGDAEFLFREIQNQLEVVANFYASALERLGELQGSTESSEIVSAYSAQNLGFELDAQLIDFISVRCERALSLISETEGGISVETWEELNTIRFELFAIYGAVQSG